MSKSQRNADRRSASEGAETRDRRSGRKRRTRRDAADKVSGQASVGQLLHDARKSAGLTQVQLAKMIGTDQSVISRLENPEYEGHSLAMLRRIAHALAKRLDVRFVDSG